MSSRDQTYIEMDARKEKRIERENNLRKITTNDCPSNNLNDSDIRGILETLSSEDEMDQDDAEFTLSLNQRPSSVTIQLPRKRLFKETAQVAERCQMSIRDAVAFTSRIIGIGGATVDDFSLSISTAFRQRQEQRTLLAKEIKNQFMKNKPPFVVVHWDGKLVEKLTGTKNDRIAIIVSGKPTLDSSKLLGVPISPDSTGFSQKTVVMDALNEWQLVDQVVGLSFDTNASNTGAFRGSATLIEIGLNRAVLWLPCRHHIYELHVKHA
jgi:hypothetical protein